MYIINIVVFLIYCCIPHFHSHHNKPINVSPRTPTLKTCANMAACCQVGYSVELWPHSLLDRQKHNWICIKLPFWMFNSHTGTLRIFGRKVWGWFSWKISLRRCLFGTCVQAGECSECSRINNQVSGSVSRRIEATYQSQNSIEFPVRTCNDLRLVFTFLYMFNFRFVDEGSSIVLIYMIPFKAACFDGPETPDATDIRHGPGSWVIESLNVVEDRRWGGSEEASGM